MVIYKINVMDELKKAGWNSSRLRKEKILGQSSIAKIRNKENISFDNLNKICLMLRCQPSDIIEVCPTDEEKLKYF